MHDYLIVGSGIFGAVFAQQAIEKGKSVILIDKREHIAGNCYTETKNGIDIHTYGPHIFHTSNEQIWSYVNRFTSFNNYVNRPKVSYKNKIYSFPINLMTLQQLWGVSTPNEAKRKLDEVKIPCENPSNLEEWILSQVGVEIYRTFIHGYTTKQWGREPDRLPASIIKRLPIRLTYDDNYFNDTFQGIPKNGYTSMFQNMLEKCEIVLGEDYFNNRDYWNSKAKKVVYTGKIDEFFDYSHGELQYRSLRFEHFESDGDFQGNAVVNYTDKNVPYTRITEHKHFTPERLSKLDKTIYTKEYSSEWNRSSIPYYPIGDEKNNSIYEKYSLMADSSDVIFGGRLAEYKYYDMHQVIGSALQKSRKYIV